MNVRVLRKSGCLFNMNKPVFLTALSNLLDEMAERFKMG